MTQSRRQFMQTAGSAAVLCCLPSVSRGGIPTAAANAASILVPSTGQWSDPDFSALAQQAVDAALAAGATYADVRITIERVEHMRDIILIEKDHEWHGIGVRVFVDGYWGFMASAVWSTEEMVRLARNAVAQARANSAGIPSDTVLTNAPSPVKNGEWTMPIKYDPFDVPKGEKMDFLRYLVSEFRRYDDKSSMNGTLRFYRKHQIFASSDGTSWKQTTYSSELEWGSAYPAQPSIEAFEIGLLQSKWGTPMGKGWEYLVDTDFSVLIPAFVEETRALRFTTETKIDRYDTVMKASVVAGLADFSLGAATELDRAMGYEANAGGTSYLSDPLEMLGTYKVGNEKLTVTADRTMSGGLATVKWDDESVVSEPVTLVKNGILTDYQTNRETAQYLAPYYERIGRPVRSNGCASSQSGLFITTQHTANIRVHPGSENRSFEDLVASTEKGIAVTRIKFIDVDQQQLNGVIDAEIREIRAGKLGRYMNGAGFMVRAPELWKSLTALGGPASEELYGFQRRRGQPQQIGINSVSAVPAKFTNIGVLDLRRR